MKDIDFDELDKAVSSVLEGNSPTPAAAPTSPAPVPVQTSSSSPAPIDDQSSEVPISVSTPAPAIIPAPPRRSGRFMDVVHPSSDMKGDAKPSSERPIVTTGMRIEPLSNNIVPEDAAPAQQAAQADAPTPEKLPVSLPVDPGSLVSTPDTTDEAKWPDPLDVAVASTSYTGTQEPDSGAPAEVSSDGEVSVLAGSEPVEQPTDAPKSPFITDAKVEKRPLGAFSDPSAQPAAAAEAATESTDVLTQPDVKPSDDEQLPPQVTDKSDEPLPPELSSDLVSLEGTDQGDAAEPTTAPAVEAPSVPQVTVSIPQQYKEAARAEAADEHPVFAAEDHAPLPVTKKKSSPLIWILLIVLILAIVAGAGAYWYFYLR